MNYLTLPQSEVAKITDEATDQNFYNQHGYLVLKSVFPPEQIDRLAAWSKRRFWNADGKLLFRRLQDEWKTVAEVRELALNSTILAKLRSLYGREPVPFQTLNFPVGTEQATHSDTIHFNCFPQRFMCGVWVSLEPVGPDNGPLHYYPGSHRLPVLEFSDVQLNPDDGVRMGDFAKSYSYYEKAIKELIELSGIEKHTVKFEKGDVLIWAANLLHGGEPIKVPNATRLSQVTHYYFEGCRYYTPIQSDLPNGQIQFRNGIRSIKDGELVPQMTSGLLPRENTDGFFTRMGKRLDSIAYRIRFGRHP